MAEYTYEYANFPKKGLINLHNFEDISDDIAAIVNKIQALQANGKYSEAAKIIRDNNDILENKIVGSKWYNTIIEEIRNAQIYAKGKKQCVFTDDNEPVYASEQDIWIGV